MTLTFHPDAERDVASAMDFYHEHAGAVVAARFLGEFERVVGLLLRNPGLGAPGPKGRRSFPFQVFPYSVVYRITDSDLRVLLVRHQHRRPTYGAARR